MHVKVHLKAKKVDRGSRLSFVGSWENRTCIKPNGTVKENVTINRNIFKRVEYGFDGEE